MHINSVKINGFKNLKNVEIYPDEKLNILYGENAQGKTNLIEAIWICSGVRSFRGTKDKDFIDINGEISQINIKFSDSQREQDIQYNMARTYVKEKSISLNGVKVKAASKLFGKMNCVIFTPEDLELSKGSPENRRNFLDLCIAQIKKSYNGVISKYENLILQRNSLLKNINFGISSVDELDVWDLQIAKLGAYISVLRYHYAKKLNIFTKNLYYDISSEKEQLELIYSSTVYESLEGRTDFNGEMSDEYYKLLKKNVRDDLKAGFTTAGIHRDDLITKINNLSVREFGSQGQKRSVALVLKLAQAYILLEETDESPVILLDDVLSELDRKRQSFVISKIDKMQVFITCCDKSFSLNKKTGGNYYQIKNGEIIKKTSNLR